MQATVAAEVAGFQRLPWARLSALDRKPLWKQWESRWEESCYSGHQRWASDWDHYDLLGLVVVVSARAFRESREAGIAPC